MWLCLLYKKYKEILDFSDNLCYIMYVNIETTKKGKMKMENLEKEFFDYYVSDLIRSYGYDIETANAIAKMMKKENKEMWEQLFNIWVDEVHPY